jgi:hypothetical protein
VWMVLIQVPVVKKLKNRFLSKVLRKKPQKDEMDEK